MLRDKIKIPISELEQSAFCRNDEDLDSKTLEEEFSAGVRWQKLPISYMRTTPEDLEANILSARKKLGDRVVVLGHHYQRDEVNLVLVTPHCPHVHLFTFMFMIN